MKIRFDRNGVMSFVGVPVLDRDTHLNYCPHCKKIHPSELKKIFKSHKGFSIYRMLCSACGMLHEVSLSEGQSVDLREDVAFKAGSRSSHVRQRRSLSAVVAGVSVEWQENYLGEQ